MSRCDESRHGTPPSSPQAHDRDPERGRHAESPTEIPRRGWRDILLRVKSEVARDNLSMIAAGVSFYLLFALVPGLAAALSIYALVADPAQIQEQFEAVSGVLPREVHDTIATEMTRIAENSGKAGFGALLGLAVVLWSGSRGMIAMMTAMNIVYEEEERRNWFVQQALAIGFTLGAILVLAISVVAIAAAPGILEAIGLGTVATMAISIGRWVILLGIALFGLSVMYRWGPCRKTAQWRWASAGAVAATVAWLLVSWLFSFYVSNFGNYDKTYGSMGVIVVLMMWLYLSTFVILVGGELNAEMEHQTGKDTTTGPPKEMGQRGAEMADTVGEVP